MMRYDTYEYHCGVVRSLALYSYRYTYTVPVPVHRCLLVATCTVCLQVSMIRCRYPYGIVEVERYVHTGTCTGTEQGLINQN